MSVTILIPAAGFSRRMRGADKLLEPVGGMPLLRRQAARAAAAAADVRVTLPPPESPRGAARLAALEGLNVVPVFPDDPSEGMAASIRAGLATVPETATGLMILLADLPEIETADLTRLVAAFEGAPDHPILRATAEDGTAGHPVIFPRDLFAELAALSGDTGPRPVIAAHPARLRRIALPGARATTDLDTPEDWRDWRARTGH